MTKQVNYFFICAFAAFSISSTNAAEKAEALDNSPTSGTEPLVMHQAEEISEGEPEVSQPEGDDDFVPSARISEDLSVSFPVDI